MGLKITICAGAGDLAEKAAAAMTPLLSETTARASLALAGGNTPKELYRLLAAPPWREQIPWQRLDLFWGDERAVPPGDSASNYRMARETLLESVPLDLARIHRARGEAVDLEAEAVRYAEEIQGVLGGGNPSFDLVLLGLGADGHTASLFPNSPVLTAPRLVAAVPAPPPGGWRLTFTPKLLNASKNVFFLVAGAAKSAAVREVLEGSAEPTLFPAKAVVPTAGQVHWFLDDAAATQLKRERY